MRAEILAADRAFEVRRAAATWRVAGEIDTQAERRIGAIYADDRRRTSTAFRVLYFLFAFLGFSAAQAFGLLFLWSPGAAGSRESEVAALCLASGLLLLPLVEALTARLRLRRHGVEEAFAWLAWTWTLGGGIWLLAETTDLDSGVRLGIAGAAGALLGAFLAWRWGIPGSGIAAGVALFGALAQAGAGRALWIVVSGFLVVPLARLGSEPRLGPEQRRRALEAFWVAMLALYSAVHVEGVEPRIVPWLRVHRLSESTDAAAVTSSWALWASWIAMLGIPTVLLVVGLRWRFRPALQTGMLLALATAGSVVARLGVGPGWLVSLVGGTTLVVLALALRRFFANRPGEEWRGWTARPVAESRDGFAALEMAATLATLTPRAKGEVAGFEGAKGEFGGGGASATY